MSFNFDQMKENEVKPTNQKLNFNVVENKLYKDLPPKSD